MLDLKEMAELLPASNSKVVPVSNCVVRLKTSIWQDTKGVHFKKSLVFMRRQCAGYNLLESDADAIGVEVVLPLIINLDTCTDGVYQVVACNRSYDENGYVDDYAYQLLKMD